MNVELKLGVLGNPIAQSPSPKMYHAAAKELGIKVLCEAYLVSGADDLKTFVDKVRQDEIHGFNVTIPFKEKIIPFLDELTEEAKDIQAVNTVWHQNGKAVGHNTDGRGFIMALQKTFAPDFSLWDVIVFGAGGAAKAICYHLCKEGAQSLMIVNRTWERAEKLKTHLQKLFPKIILKAPSPWPKLSENVIPAKAGTQKLLKSLDPRLRGDDKKCISGHSEDFFLLINATSLGMFGKSEWPDFSFMKDLSKDCLVADIVANPIHTEFLKAAQTQGLRAMPGWKMLLHQGVESFEIFTGQKPNVAVMQAALLEGLT